MVGAGGAELREAGGVLRVHEAEDLLVGLDGTDKALLLAHLTTEPRKDGGEGAVAGCLVEGLVLRTAEGSGVTTLGIVLCLDVGGCLVDEGECLGVAGLGIVIPGDEAVLAHHDGLDRGVLALDLLHGEAELEAGAHPSDIFHLATEDLLGELLATLAGCNGDDSIRVHMIDALAGQEAVERRVNRGGAGIEVEGGVGVGADHIVLGLGLESLVGAGAVALLEADQLFLVEGGEVFALGGAEIAAGTFDPEDLDQFAGEGILLHDLGGGVAAAGVGDALVGAEEVGAVDELVDGIELGGLGVIPEVGQWLVGHGFGWL